MMPNEPPPIKLAALAKKCASFSAADPGASQRDPARRGAMRLRAAWATGRSSTGGGVTGLERRPVAGDPVGFRPRRQDPRHAGAGAGAPSAFFTSPMAGRDREPRGRFLLKYLYMYKY